MPILDYSQQPAPTPAEKQAFQEMVATNQQMMARERADQHALEVKVWALIIGVALLILILFGRRIARFLRETVLNSLALGVRGSRKLSSTAASLKEEIVRRADEPTGRPPVS